MSTDEQYDDPGYDDTDLDTGPTLEDVVAGLAERANAQDLGALLQAHPEYADETAASELLAHAEELATAAGNPSVAADPAFLRFVADHRAGGAPDAPPVSDAEGFQQMLQGDRPSGPVLPF